MTLLLVRSHPSWGSKYSRMLTRSCRPTTETSLPSPPPFSHNDNANPTASIPLALARMYELPFVNDPQPYWVRRSSQEQNTDPANYDNEPAEYSRVEYSPAELQGCVEAYFSRSPIIPHPVQRPNEEIRYLVMDRDGNHISILCINSDTGRVFTDLRDKNELKQDRDNDRSERNSIRLGLYDLALVKGRTPPSYSTEGIHAIYY